ncbi:MAG: 3'-5' exonuclease [Mariprofundaceae bacterium]|nr:3'-5' exonuclease [Mariprofundaceae bacterium]
MQRDLIVFDIETVPDAKATRQLLGEPELTDIEARDALSSYFLEKTNGNNDFPRQPFHQVVAISYAHLICEPGEEGIEMVVRRIASGGDKKSSEAELLDGFFSLIEKRAPRLVSFNGRGFDIPVLKYRAMAHSLSCPRWFSEGDRWKNYDARYDLTYHIDLLEVLSDFGASARCSMHEVASAFGIPGKLDTAGDDVRGMFEAGEIEAIRNYCETDVCTTLLTLLRWQLFSGALPEGAYARAVLGVRNYLEGEATDRPHLGRFLSVWDQLDPS